VILAARSNILKLQNLLKAIQAQDATPDPAEQVLQRKAAPPKGKQRAASEQAQLPASKSAGKRRHDSARPSSSKERLGSPQPVAHMETVEEEEEEEPPAAYSRPKRSSARSKRTSDNEPDEQPKRKKAKTKAESQETDIEKPQVAKPPSKPPRKRQRDQGGDVSDVPTEPVAKKSRKLNIFGNAQPVSWQWDGLPQADDALGIPAILSPIKASASEPARPTSTSILGRIGSGMFGFR